MDVNHTRQALLNAAEVLFAERGFSATSMRVIASRAGANLAAANYHFGGKRGLMQAVLERRVTPLNRERLALLDAMEVGAKRKPPSLERVLEAFVGPALRLSDQASGHGEAFVRLMGRTFIEPDAELNAFFMNLFKEVAGRFIKAIHGAVPGLPAPDLFWRLHFMIGGMAHTMGDKERLRLISSGCVNPDDTKAAISQLVTFIAGGLRAPHVTPRKRRRR